MTERGFDSPRRAFNSALTEQARVVSALMLRDIKTRFGATYFGFLIGLLIPLAHIGILLTVWTLLGRRAPIGTDITVYLATGVLPFVIWSYTHRKVMQAFTQNRALTAFPIVKYIDIWVARSLVEILNAVLIAAFLAVALALRGHDLFVPDPARLAYGLTLAYLLGTSTGFLLGLISLLVPGAAIAGNLLIPLYYATAGVFFIPEALPEKVRFVVSLFPLSHILEYVRIAVFPSYLSDFSRMEYVYAIIAGLFLVCLLLERYLRPILTAK